MALRPFKFAAKTVFAAADVFFPPLEGPRILLYHQVESNLGREMEVSLDVFRKHIDWLADNGEIIDLDTAISRRGGPDSDPIFVLTFDDGYADLYAHAYPLLLERGLPFTIYLTTYPVESRVPLAPGATPLTWDQLTDILDSGLLTLGAHTHRHVDMRALDAARVDEELELSDALIEKRLGARPQHFAYPWGLWSEIAESRVAQRYETAALAAVGSLIETTSVFRLPRIPIQDSDKTLFFQRKVASGLQAEEKLRQFAKGYSTPPPDAENA